MADILIRGMDMPANCSECPCCDTHYGTCKGDKHNPMAGVYGIPKWCPLVPLPEGHGRLGDLDVLEAKLREEALKHTCIGDLNRMTLGVGDAIDRIRMTKTLVPADVTDIDVGNKKEGGGEDG